MQLTRQIGEHLVAAELGRRGYVATPFAGNIPMYDRLAADIGGHGTPVRLMQLAGGGVAVEMKPHDLESMSDELWSLLRFGISPHRNTA